MSFQDKINAMMQKAAEKEAAQETQTTEATTTEKPVEEKPVETKEIPTETKETPKPETQTTNQETTDDSINVELQVEKTDTPTSTTNTLDREGWYSPEAFQQQQSEWDTKYKELESQLTANSNPFASEQIQKMNEFVKGGGDLDERFWRYQSMNIDEFNRKDKDQALFLLRESMALQDFDQDEINYKLKQAYPILFKSKDDLDLDDDEYTSRYNDTLLQMSIDAKSAANQLREYQQKVLLPKAQQVDPEVQRREQQRIQQQEQAYSSFANQKLSEFNQLQIKVGDAAINIKVSEQAKNQINPVITDPKRHGSYITDKYLKEINGEKVADVEQFVKDEFIVNNWESILKSVIQQAIAVGKNQYVKEDLKNTDLDTAKAHVSNEPASIEAQIGQQVNDFFKNKYSRKK